MGHWLVRQHTYTMYSVISVSIVHLILYISAKLQSIWLLCQHVYTMQHINYIPANLWATGWSKSIPTLCKNSEGAFCIDL